MYSDSQRALFLTPDIEVKEKQDGCCYLYSRHSLETLPNSILDYLQHWAKQQPDTIFLAERCPTNPEEWRYISYAEMYQKICVLALALKEAGLSKGRPLMLLSGNSIAFAQVMLACMLIEAPVVPVSPSYSLLSQDFNKVKYIHELVNPGLVFVEDEKLFSAVLKVISKIGTSIVTPGPENYGIADYTLAQWLTKYSKSSFAFTGEDLQPDAIAKILFTSGSTGMPKGVINTHRMLVSNQEMMAKIWPFMGESHQIILDWLPWHHTFGGNHNFNLVLRNGGTLYIDGGKPSPEGIKTTLRNLGEVSPTIYFNVAAGYELLVAFLEQDACLAKNFFRELRLLFFAAAALPRTIWDRLQALIDQYAPHPIPITSSWGATETAPLCTSVYFSNTINNNIGLPVPGTMVKLAPVGDLTELRVKGPNITPGYFNNDAQTAEVFDEEGFFCSGDAVELIDRKHLELGLRFKGRVNENFKLLTGTWVNVGELRIAIVEALSPLATDVVICGHNQRYLSVMIFPNVNECERLLGGVKAHELPTSSQLQEELARRLMAYNETNSGSSRRIKKALVLDSPPSLDDNEITDKGYLNQRGVLTHRAAQVEKLYAETADDAVINC